VEPNHYNTKKIYYGHFLNAFTKIALTGALISCKAVAKY
jgi:hypothetical protein